MTPLQVMQLAGIVIGAIVVLGGATVYLTSRWRQATDEQRTEYIKALEDRNAQLEAEVERRDEEIERLNDRIDDLERRVELVQDMVLRQCRYAEVDHDTGGCRFCTKGLQYGRGG